MKRTFAALAALVLLAGASPASAPVNYNAFGIAALQRLTGASKTQNVFISPVSIGVALAMTAEGAKGATREAILKTLGVSESGATSGNAALIASLNSNPDASVGIANAVWTRDDVKPLAQFVSLLETRYGAQAQALRFGDPSAAQAINAWTKAHTLGLIDRIVDDTKRSDFLYLTNALAFKATWTSKFQANDTHPMPFTNADGRKSMVQMMTQSADFAIYEAPRFSALRMPYGQGGCAAYVLLPKGNAVDPLVKELTAPLLDRIARQARQSYLAVSLPRFTASYNASLAALLRAMGMGVAFTGHADFSAIHAIPPRLAITSVNHASYVRVDEEGTTAAAATSVGISLLALRRAQKQFVVDHPFVLVLRDERTGAVLFIGAIRTINS